MELKNVLSSANDFVQAKKWCETAINFCRYINNGMLYEEEVIVLSFYILVFFN